MSLLERTRPTARSDRPRAGAAADAWRQRAIAAAHGALAAVASWAVVCLPVLAAWWADDKSTTSSGAVIGVGADTWVLAHGGAVVVGTSSFAFMALLLTVLPLLAATVSCRHLLTRQAERPDAISCAWWRCAAAQELLLFVGGYAATGVFIALLGRRLGPAHPVVLTVLPGVVLLPLLAIGLALRRQHRRAEPGLSDGIVRGLQRVRPAVLSRALRPARLGVLSLLGTGLAVVMTAVLLHLGRIGQLYDSLGTGAVGVAVLTLVQLLSVPNLALWAVGWMAGPGFAVGGVAVSWSHVDAGVLPLVPVLGGLPQPGAPPGGMWLAAVVPIAVGALVGWRCVRAVTRLASWRSKAEPAVVASVIVAVVVGVLAWLASGALGSGHLAHVGVRALPVTGALLVEVLTGAITGVTLLHWRQTRR